MKLYFLRPIKNWDPWYDKAFGFVIRAENIPQARALATKHRGDEGEMSWLDPGLTTCEELREDGPACVILRDFASA